MGNTVTDTLYLYFFMKTHGKETIEARNEAHNKLYKRLSY